MVDQTQRGASLPKGRELVRLEARAAKTFKTRLRQLLSDRGWTQGQLAEELSVSVAAVKKWLATSTTNVPEGRMLLRLAWVTGRSVDWFLGLPAEGDTLHALRAQVQTRVRARAGALGLTRNQTGAAVVLVTSGDALLRHLEDVALAELAAAVPRLRQPDVGFAANELMGCDAVPASLKRALHAWATKREQGGRSPRRIRRN